MGGNLTLTAITAGTAAAGDGNVNLSTTTSGNVVLGSVTAAADTITIVSAGSIQESPGDAGADLTADTLSLTAVSGIFGTSAAEALEISATTLTLANVTGTGAINLSDTTGGLTVTSPRQPTGTSR